MRTTYVWDAALGDWVPRPPRAAPSRRVQVIGDFAVPVFSHADGRSYTSRRHWRDHLKAHGLVEFGNDRVERRPFEPREAVTDLQRAAAGHRD